ncbi:MAG: UDP-N-acetylglucosamine 2-epimerase, partial [Terrimesophilobacter sp.]
EAGLRSFNRRMPEEHNRVLTDHAADLLLAPTTTAMDHLAAEGLSDRSVLVGDVMTDVLYSTLATNKDGGRGGPNGVTRGEYFVATIHRPDNTDTKERLASIIGGLSALDHPVLLLVHPRLANHAKSHGIDLAVGSIRPVEPLAYPQLVAAVEGSAGVITDSGGLQKEAFLLRVPCTTIRTETEWVETIELGWNQLVTDELDGLANAVRGLVPLPTSATPYGDGHAAERVAKLLTSGPE